MSQTTDAIDHARREWGEHADLDMEALQAAAAQAPQSRSLTEVLSADELALIVEPKRATPTRGTIHPELDIAAVAAQCEAGGASAVSVVTEPRLSHGSHDDVRAARSGCTLPIIARDFVVDVRQVYALRAAGADALFVPAHVYVGRDHDDRDDDHDADAVTGSFSAIVRTAQSLGMEVVLSVCTDEELAFALDTDVDVLNIDNREERGNVDVERTFELLADVPVGWPVISESIAAIDQVSKLQRAGVDALLLDEGHIETGLASALAVYAERLLDR